MSQRVRMLKSRLKKVSGQIVRQQAQADKLRAKLNNLTINTDVLRDEYRIIFADIERLQKP